MTPNHLDLSMKAFEGAKYQASDFEIQNLAVNLKLLEQRGLSKLNHRLLESKEKIRDTFAEHNFAAKLLLRHNSRISINYEPDEGLRRPPDFKVCLGDRTYWIQMKKLSELERENRQRKIVKKLSMEYKAFKWACFLDAVCQNILAIAIFLNLLNL